MNATIKNPVENVKQGQQVEPDDGISFGVILP